MYTIIHKICCIKLMLHVIIIKKNYYIHLQLYNIVLECMMQ